MAKAGLSPSPRPPSKALLEAEREADYWRVKALALTGAISRLQEDLKVSEKQAKNWARKREGLRGKLGASSR